MLIHRIAPLAIAAALAVVGCQDAADKEHHAEKVQAQANQQKSEAQQKADQARAEADQQLAQEEGDYRDKIQKAIGDQDATIADLQATAGNVNLAATANANKLLDDVGVKRAALQADLKQLGMINADQWERLHMQIDTDLSAFDAAVRTASSNIKAMPGRGQATANTNKTFSTTPAKP